jgi:hypothetical protein
VKSNSVLINQLKPNNFLASQMYYKSSTSIFNNILVKNLINAFSMCKVGIFGYEDVHYFYPIFIKQILILFLSTAISVGLHTN